MRYLGLDVGKMHLGVAVGEILASELTTIIAAPNTNFYSPGGQNQAIEKVDKIFIEQQADAIVIGLPVKEDGSMSDEATKIRQFGEELKKATNFTIHYVNETLTTFMAEDMLESQGLNRKEAKIREHQLAAQLILQQFLEENA